MHNASRIDLLLRTLQLGAARPDDVDELLPLLSLVEAEGAERWLLRRLVEIGADPDSALVQGLRSRVRAEATRTVRQEEELRRVLALFDQAGIACVLIKGAARLVLARTIPYLDARPTRDIDLLLPPGAAPKAWELLRSQGYQVAPVIPPPGHHHLPGLVGELRVAVEIHSAVGGTVSPEASWERLGASATVERWAGCDVRIPPPGEVAWHAVVHAIGDGGAGYRLKNLLPVAAIFRSGLADSNWWPERTSEVIDRWTGARVGAAALTRWLNAAGWLGGREPGFPFGLRALLHWETRVTRASRWLGRGLVERALTEAPRVELGFPPEPSWPGDGWVARSRRRLAAALSRRCFRLTRTAT